MVCTSCRHQDHEHCADARRLKAAKKGEITGVIGIHSSALCDCGHVIVTDLSKIGVKEVIE